MNLSLYVDKFSLTLAFYPVTSYYLTISVKTLKINCKGAPAMLKKLQKTNSEGFTIIEVMIVLAIAALILLIVLLAVPALQRGSRNTQRKNDVSALAGAIVISPIIITVHRLAWQEPVHVPFKTVKLGAIDPTKVFYQDHPNDHGHLGVSPSGYRRPAIKIEFIVVNGPDL